jgi:hypothetical protein
MPPLSFANLLAVKVTRFEAHISVPSGTVNGHGPSVHVVSDT